MAAPKTDSFVFALSPTPDGVPLLTIGITRQAWEHMRGGKTNTLDLFAIGIPLKLMLFGARTRREAEDVLLRAAETSGVPLVDGRGTDFGIKDNERKH